MFWLTEVSCVIVAKKEITIISWNLLLHVIIDSKLVMYFTVNVAFTNCLDMFPNLTDSFPLIKDRTTYEQPIPVNLSIQDFDKYLLHVPTNMKNFVQDYAKSKEIFDLEERLVSRTLSYSSKNFLSNNYIMDIFMFTSSVISLISTTLIICLFCKHKQIRMLITSLILHKIRDVEASSNETNSECKTLAYIGTILTILSLIIVTCKTLAYIGTILTILSLIIVTFLHYRKSRFCKGQKFLNVVKIRLFQTFKSMSQ